MKTAILLTNLGTPSSLKKADIRRYLSEFLADIRVVNPSNLVKKILWKIILNVIILNTRPQKLTEKYAKIWDSFGVGSPLLSITKLQLTKVERILKKTNSDLIFAMGMRYGEPSIAAALKHLQSQHCEKIIVLPLYPQKSGATTLSTLDALNANLNTWHKKPKIVFIQQYYQESAYIQALANSIIEHQRKHGKPDKLIISFHGMPQAYIDAGDVYYQHCLETTKLLTQALNLRTDEYVLSFQSIFGREKWIEPHTDKTLKALAGEGIEHVQVVCPGFSADCLETLEEIDQENRGYFIDAGGKKFSYIPALNDRNDHIEVLCGILSTHLT